MWQTEKYKHAYFMDIIYYMDINKTKRSHAIAENTFF